MGTPAIDMPALGGEGKSKKPLRLWLRLLTCSNLIEQTVRRRLRAEFATTLPRFDMLAALERAPEGLSMGGLSRHLMVSNGNVTGIADRLEKDGLISRLPSPTDRRTQIARLTRRGERDFAAMAAAHESWIDDLLGGLSGTEKDRLIGLLDRARHLLQSSEDKEH